MGTAFPGNIDNFAAVENNVDVVDASHINDLQAAITALETKVGKDVSTVVTSLDWKVNKFFETGRRMWIWNKDHPDGWSKHSATDVVIGVAGGSYGTAKNDYAGTWTQPNHVHAGPNHSHTIGYQSLPHVHGIVSWNYNHLSAATGTNNGGTANTGGGATANTHRPRAAVGIIIEKD